MTIFDEIAIIRGKIKSVEEKIEYIQYQASTPKTSIISDMPKGGGNVGNPLEKYLVKKDVLTERLEALNYKAEMLWQKAAQQMKAAGIDNQAREMMYLRFMIGLQWKKCAAYLYKKYPDNKWNVNKCFRVYRAILCKIPKKHQQTL